MLKNEEIHQTHPFYRKGLNYLEPEWITCGCICAVHKKEWRDHCGVVDVPKTYFSQRNQMTITWVQLAKDASIVPSFTFILHVHRQTNCSEAFSWKFSERILFTTFKHLQSFLVAFNEQLQNAEKSQGSVVEVVSCFATVKATIQVKPSDIHIKPIWISTKKIQRRQGSWLWFIHVRCICIVKVLCCTSG